MSSSWELRARLVGGAAAAAVRTRPTDWTVSTAGVSDDAAVSRCLERVTDARRGRLSVERVESIIAELHTLLAGRRTALLGVLFGSDALIADFPLVEGADRWFQLCWIAEASWRAVTGELADRTFAAGDRELLYPLAARLRFHVLSEPMRFRAARINPWLPAEDERDFGPNGVIGQVFGAYGWNVLVGRGREARRVWLTCLNSYQSHPLLTFARPSELEAELSWLVFARRYSGAPLGFSVRPLGMSAALTAEDRAAIEETTDQHLLPRFRMFGVAGLALHADKARARAGRTALAIITVLVVAAAVASAATLQFHAATVFAATCYLLIGIGSLSFGTSWTAPWQLRLPAACALGLAVLLTLPPGWWQTPRVGWAAAAVLVGAAYGYLVVEARNHGVGRVAALWRSAGVAMSGAVHGLLVSLIGLVAVAPAFIDKGDELAAVWRAPSGYGQAGMILLLSTCWCLAVGVFSQILWDDRPVTARLAHLHWRSERSA
ncbi:MAG: hypothetical protein ACRDSP_22565 [Pseudonocardiaceae bacterium]